MVFSSSSRTLLAIQVDMEVVFRLLLSIHQMLLMKLCMKSMIITQIVSFIACISTISSIVINKVTVLKAQNTTHMVVHSQCLPCPFVLLVHQITNTVRRSSGSTRRICFKMTWVSHQDPILCTEYQLVSRSHPISKDLSKSKGNPHPI